MQLPEIVHHAHQTYAIAPLLIAQGLMSAYELANSLFSKKKADDELNSLKHPNYSVSPELSSAYNRAQDMANYGYAPAQKANFRNQIAEDINTTERRALDMGGGNLAKTVSALGNIQHVDAESKFAASDAALKDAHIAHADRLASEMQAQKNRAAGEDISEYIRKAQAYGQASAQQQNNIYSALGNATAVIGGVSGGRAAPSHASSSGLINPYYTMNNSSVTPQLKDGVSLNSNPDLSNQYDWNFSQAQQFSLPQ